jgi:multiple antibiotic resistance protein
MLIALHAYLLGFPALFSIVDPISGALISRAATVQWPRDTHPRLVSRITLSDGLLIAEFNGLPSSASQVL